ncbi:hypothetical protein JX265_008227 [Neoarthrinium moseri]|uniref:CMP/dCMP-type deaminase domain-containing protein n=1 Tax=Neoarthrinium moseri TaxID=1658444 RepID=A0A9P9WIG0_9PEZI|nr:hypothetical protein JX265_008227 [Neoarthrinium moseri]
MAGHKFSGYISGLWQALFASFIHLFNRIFHLAPSSNTTSPEQPPASGGEQAASEPSATNPSSTPDTSRAQHPADLDLEKGLPSSEDESMAASKKRGGQRRSGFKPHAAQPAASTSQRPDKENLGPGKQPSQTALTPSDPTHDKVAPLGTSAQAGNSHVTVSGKQTDGQSPTGTKPSGKNRGRVSPTKQLVEGTKDDLVTADRETASAAVSQTPPLPAVVPAGHQPAVRDTGSHIQAGAQKPDPAVKPAAKEATRPMNGQADESSSISQFDPTDKVVPVKELNKDTAAVEAAAVPLVVATGLPQQSFALKPLAPLVTPPSQVLPGLIEPDTEEGKREREIHLKFMREALNMGESALGINETPVGCVLVYKNRVIAKGMNATNVTRNGTRHAEFMALSALLSHQSDADVKDESSMDESLWADVDPSDGHIFPYGQKLHPSPKVDRSIISECVLYVTVEPCVMCASLLRQLGIKRVYFGAVNDKFGGTGGVFRIHVNSRAVPKPTTDRPYQNGYGPQDADQISKGRVTPSLRDEDDGDGGNVEPGYPADGGFLRDEAVSLLRRFYVQENGRAPQPRKKEGRAARLYAMENAANSGNLSDTDGPALPDTPVDAEAPPAGSGKFIELPKEAAPVS